MRTLLDQLSQLPLDLSSFHWSDRKSVRGACPRCGGHRRLLIFVDRPFPSWNYRCDGCGVEGWISDFNSSLKMSVSPEERARMEAEREREEKQRAEYRRKKLAEFSTSDLWTELHERMKDENKQWWREVGVPDDWQEFWKLGYTPAHTFEHNEVLYTRPAYTIPKFDLGWKPANMDFRIVDPPEGVGKYRPKPGLPPAPFLTRPDLTELTNDGRLFIFEGSKKAMVAGLRLPDGPQSAGVPSCTSWGGIVEKIKAAKLSRVYITLDPDAEAWAYKLAVAIGSIARVVPISVKVDDAIIHYGLTIKLFLNICTTQGRKVGA